MFNAERITNLEKHVAEAQAKAEAVAARATAAGRLMTTSEHRQVEKALAEMQEFRYRLQHERALAGTFGPRY